MYEHSESYKEELYYQEKEKELNRIIENNRRTLSIIPWPYSSSIDGRREYRRQLKQTSEAIRKRVDERHKSRKSWSHPSKETLKRLREKAKTLQSEEKSLILKK